MTDTMDWGDLQAVTPDNPCYRDPAPVDGLRLPDGSIHCQGCRQAIPDNSGQGLKPSCPNCWAAVNVTDPPAPTPQQPPRVWRPRTSGSRPKEEVVSVSSKANPPTGEKPVVVDPFDPNSFLSPDKMSAEAQASSPSGETEGTQDSRVELIVFDMGHVFVDFEWEEVCKGFYTRSGHTREEFKEVLAYVGGLGYERGTISTEDFLAALNERLGITLTVKEFTTLWNATFRENPEMAALLQSLRQRYPLYLLSNINEVHHQHLQDNYNVARHFQELILSYQVGYAKPQQEIYEEVLKRSGLPAQSCLFVDDLPPNVRAAEALGMKTIQFVGIDDLRQRLAALGVVVS